MSLPSEEIRPSSCQPRLGTSAVLSRLFSTSQYPLPYLGFVEPSDTRARLLRVVWDEIRGLTPANVQNYPPAARAIAAGATATDIAAAMTAAKYETAFRLLFLLAAEHVEEGNYDATVGWSLVEADMVEDEAVPRASAALNSVHEDLLTSDPTGMEGADFLR